MELITILSTIILIATISTFILSIGAYILFKIRSRREHVAVITTDGPVQAELVTIREADDYGVRNQNSNKTHLPRVQMNEIEHESVHNDIKKQGENEQQRIEKRTLNKYAKYSNVIQNTSQNNPTAGDLQWK